MSSPQTSCLVCGAPGAEPHFGGISCRACAAFFRRYFHSKKSVISCTCQIRFQNSHPCRECRIQKCIEAGMIPEKVQHKREKHPQKGVKKSSLPSSSPSSSSSQSPPPLAISPMPLQIVSRDISNTSHVVSKWYTIQDKRRPLYGKRLDEVTYFDTIMATKIDCELFWEITEKAFPQLGMLTSWDKDALLRNFHPKWALLVAAIDLEINRLDYTDVTTPEAYFDMVINFYRGSCYDGYEIEADEVLRVFEPHLRHYGLNLALPINEKQFDPMEYMALAMIVLFDGAHTNLSPEVSNLCHNIRNLILRELRGYHSNLEEKEGGGEMRFIETIDTLSLIERGESKFQEELLLLEMYNIHIHDDYRLMLREHNY